LKDDPKPLLTIGRKTDGTGGIWFYFHTDNAVTSGETAGNLVISDEVPLATSADSLVSYLQKNFSECETSLGVTNFTFEIIENDSINTPYDYWLQVLYNSSFFYDLKYSIGVSDEMNAIVCSELKNFQEEIAAASMSAAPNKKIWGCYYDSWYAYPTLKVDLQTRYYYSWANYFPLEYSSGYNDTHISGFQWDGRIDDQLER
jgi:hypothetical protein